jgi:hypothetical protein
LSDKAAKFVLNVRSSGAQEFFIFFALPASLCGRTVTEQKVKANADIEVQLITVPESHVNGDIAALRRGGECPVYFGPLGEWRVEDPLEGRLDDSDRRMRCAGTSQW